MAKTGHFEQKQITHSPEETVRAGEEFGKTYIKAGVVVCVRGELGAGKTHFVKGIAGSLEIDERELTSPTYALANEYPLTRPLPIKGRGEREEEPLSAKGRGEEAGKERGESFRLFHLDCYRFEKPEELLELGVEDYLYPTNAATIVEWPERIERLLPEGVIDVHLWIVSETERKIEIGG